MGIFGTHRSATVLAVNTTCPTHTVGYQAERVHYEPDMSTVDVGLQTMGVAEHECACVCVHVAGT
jgi:hypothetical protein